MAHSHIYLSTLRRSLLVKCKQQSSHTCGTFRKKVILPILYILEVRHQMTGIFRVSRDGFRLA